MLTMNEQIINITRPNDRYDRRWRTDWMLYRQTHQLARDYYKIKKHRDSKILSWILAHVKDKSTVILDSFYPALVDHFTQVDCYEHVDQQNIFQATGTKFFENPTEITQRYDQVIILGERPFKYQTTDQYTQSILSYFPMMKDRAVMLTCLPMLHHCFHRLKYQPNDIVAQINQSLNTVGYRVETHTTISHNWFLKLSPDC